MSDPDSIRFDQPTRRDVAAVLERRMSSGRWAQEQWQLQAIVSHNEEESAVGLRPLSEDETPQRFLQTGLTLHLHRDECESYYHNLRSDTPSLYLVARCEPDRPPDPLLVTASFDEAAAYHEVEDEVYPAPMPPDIHAWIEAFVLAFYVPERKRKRRLNQQEKEASVGGER